MEELPYGNREQHFILMKFIERRRRARHLLNVMSRILPDTELNAVACHAIDVSLCGVGVIGSHPLEPRTACMVSFDLNHEDARKRVNARGTVVASTPLQSGEYRIGISFVDMDSRSKQLLESLDHGCNRPPFPRAEQSDK